MSSWRECKLGELGTVVTGKTPSSKNPEDWGFEMHFVTPSDYKSYGKFALSSERNLSKDGISRLQNKILPENSIMVTCIGSDMGKVAMNKIPVITNQQINSIIPDSNIVDSDFLYYRLVSLYETLRIYGSDGTAVPIVNKTDFENLETELPPLEEQKAIAEVLSSLDDKIDLLHRQNKTLEELAQTLFRQWFIEEAKEEWEKKPLKDICTIINGFAFKSGDYRESGRAIIRAMNFKQGFIDTSNVVYIDLVEEIKYSKQQLQRNDFLLVMVGASLGNFSIVTSDVLPALQNQNMWNFRSLGNISQHYLNFALRQIIENNIGSASGSAREFFQKGQFYEFLITVPSKEIVQRFHDSVENFFLKIENNRMQIQTLENLRDTLLPKLMSGEERVKS